MHTVTKHLDINNPCSVLKEMPHISITLMSSQKKWPISKVWKLEQRFWAVLIHSIGQETTDRNDHFGHANFLFE